MIGNSRTLKALLGGVAVAMTPVLTVANEARLDVAVAPQGSAVEELELVQTPGSDSYVGGAGSADGVLPPALVRDASVGEIDGSWVLVRIRQLGGSNALAIDVQGDPDSTSAKIDLSYDGAGNDHVLRVGASFAEDAGLPGVAPFRDASIIVSVIGGGNDIGDDIVGGGAAARLDYSLAVEGQRNVVLNQVGSAGSELFHSVRIVGDDNLVEISGGVEASMTKAIAFDIEGSGSFVIYDGAGTQTAQFDGVYRGDGLDSWVEQRDGANQFASVVAVNEAGAAGLVVDVSQRADNQVVFADVTHRAGFGVGQFTITQDAASPGAYYDGRTVLSAGGVGSISQ